MEDRRSALDNQRLNVMTRKRGTPYAIAWENGHQRMSQRLKKVTLCSRILLVEEARGARHQRSTEISGERHTVIATPQPAFPFDRTNCLVCARVDRDVHFPVIPRYASLLWLSNHRFVDSDEPDPMATISKTDDPIKHAVR